MAAQFISTNKNYKRLYDAPIDPSLVWDDISKLREYLDDPTCYLDMIVGCNGNAYIVVENNGVKDLKLIGTVNSDGTINNNLGQPDSTGQIKAGSISATTTIKAYRGYFGYCSDNATIPTPSEIRNQAIKGLNILNGDTISVTTNTTSRLVCFAYPSTLRDCTKIRYENLNDDDNKTAFTSITLNIPDASGRNPISYRVYYYIAPIEFGMNATFTLTV